MGVGQSCHNRNLAKAELVKQLSCRKRNLAMTEFLKKILGLPIPFSTR